MNDIIYYTLFDTVDSLVEHFTKHPDELPTRVVGVYPNTPTGIASAFPGKTMVDRAEIQPSYWTRDIPNVTFLLGSTGAILLQK